jgi:hypothetical protein
MSTAPNPVLSVAPPWTRHSNSKWVTVNEFAKEWNKHRNTIRRWCESGFLSTLGIATYCDPRGCWFIRVS